MQRQHRFMLILTREFSCQHEAAHHRAPRRQMERLLERNHTLLEALCRVLLPVSARAAR